MSDEELQALIEKDAANVAEAAADTVQGEETQSPGDNASPPASDEAGVDKPDGEANQNDDKGDELPPEEVERRREQSTIDKVLHENKGIKENLDKAKETIEQLTKKLETLGSSIPTTPQSPHLASVPPEQLREMNELGITDAFITLSQQVKDGDIDPDDANNYYQNLYHQKLRDKEISGIKDELSVRREAEQKEAFNIRMDGVLKENGAHGKESYRKAMEMSLIDAFGIDVNNPKTYAELTEEQLAKKMSIAYREGERNIKRMTTQRSSVPDTESSSRDADMGNSEPEGIHTVSDAADYMRKLYTQS